MPAQAPHAGARVAATFFSVTAPAPHPQRCEYTSKRCENARALKPNGERHRLCDHHRRLANNNQRRWQNRKKQLLRAEQSHATAAMLELHHAAGAAATTRGRGTSTDSDHSSVEVESSGATVARSDWDVATRDRFQFRPHDDSPVPTVFPRPSPLESRPQEPTCVLPRLRQHHVLSHALSLPATVHDQNIPSERLEFGGVPRGNNSRLYYADGFPERQATYSRSTSDPDNGTWRPQYVSMTGERGVAPWGARSVSGSGAEY